MPNLHGLTRTRGFLIDAESTAASHPSGPAHSGYLELFSGRVSLECTQDSCGPLTRPTLLDELRVGLKWHSWDVAVFGSRPQVGTVAALVPSTLVLSAGRLHLEHGEQILSVPSVMDAWQRGFVSGSFEADDYRADCRTADLAMRYFRSRSPKFMAVALGEPARHMDAGRYDAYLDALGAADDLIGSLVAAADEQKERATVVFVTTDRGWGGSPGHGRDAAPSPRAWMAGIGARLSLAYGEVPRHLADLAPTIRSVVGLPADIHPVAGCALPLVLEEAGERDARGDRHLARARIDESR